MRSDCCVLTRYQKTTTLTRTILLARIPLLYLTRPRAPVSGLQVPVVAFLEPGLDAVSAARLAGEVSEVVPPLAGQAERVRNALLAGLVAPVALVFIFSLESARLTLDALEALVHRPRDGELVALALAVLEYLVGWALALDLHASSGVCSLLQAGIADAVSQLGVPIRGRLVAQAAESE